MTRLKLREVEMINAYFADEQGGGSPSIVSARTPEEERAETERRRVARIELQSRLDAEAGDG